MITNRYVIPVMVAAAVHAALMLAFPGGPVPPRDDDNPADGRKHWKVPDELIVTPVNPDERTNKQDGGGEPVKSLPEDPAPPIKSDFTIPTPPVVEPDRRVTTEKIPLNPDPFAKGDKGKGPGWSIPSNIVSPDLLDHTPRARSQLEPVYPFEMRKEGIEGSVDVAFIVGKDGTVTDASAVRSSHRAFEEPALNAVRKWRFEPGRSQGRPVSFRMTVPVHFRMTAD